MRPLWLILLNLPVSWQIGLGLNLAFTLIVSLETNETKLVGLSLWIVLWAGVYWMMRRALAKGWPSR